MKFHLTLVLFGKVAMFFILAGSVGAEEYCIDLTHPNAMAEFLQKWPDKKFDKLQIRCNPDNISIPDLPD